MDDIDKKIQQLGYEADRISENPLFQEFLKIKKIMVHGQQMENLIRKKMVLSRHLIAQQRKKMEEEKSMLEEDNVDLIDINDASLTEDEVVLPQQPIPQNVRGKPPVQQSQQVKAKPVQSQPSQVKTQPVSAQENKGNYNFTKDELGIDDLNIEGLPEFEDDN